VATGPVAKVCAKSGVVLVGSLVALADALGHGDAEAEGDADAVVAAVLALADGEAQSPVAD
jgi:hypothetical protein